MPEEQWKIDVVFDPFTDSPWYRLKKWHWSVWHWRPDETTDYRFGDERTKERAHKAAVKARIEMENNIHIVTGASSEIYEAAREVIAAYRADEKEALADAIWRLDASVERGRVMEFPPFPS